MKKRTSIALALLLGWNVFAAENASAEDISKHWAYEQLTYAVEKSILKGDDKGNINPDQSIKRSEFAAILVRALELPSTDATSIAFKDVKESDWFYNEVKIASQYGLVKGKEANVFKPSDNITREEMAVMIKRAVDYYKYDSLSLNLYFDDTKSISSWAAEDIKRILSLGLMTGISDKKFAPKANTTRAEAVTVLKRFLEIDPENPIKIGQQYEDKQVSSSYESALNKQANATPKVDGAGAFIASKELISYYMNPGTFDQLSDAYYQFLKIDVVVPDINAQILNEKAFNVKNGTLYNKAEQFIEAGKKLNLNALYLMSHALHETANGTSVLAMGVEVGLNAQNKATYVTAENRSQLKEIKKVYNMYGIKAYDSSPVKSGSEYAYQQGWFTPDEAIYGGAKFIADTYVIGRKQNTLYKMRWNPENPASLQYATHVMWAEIQAKRIAKFYRDTGSDKNTVAVFEIPVYVDQPAPIEMPTQDKWYAVGKKNTGKLATVNTDSLNFRSYPVVTSASEIGKLLRGVEVTINGDNGVWYNVTVNSTGLTGWVHSQYLTIK